MAALSLLQRARSKSLLAAPGQRQGKAGRTGRLCCLLAGEAVLARLTASLCLFSFPCS